MARSRVLRLEPRPDPTVPPPDRGRLLDAEAVAGMLNQHAAHATVTAAWVTRNVRPRVKLGHKTILWWEADVRAFLESRRVA